MSSGDPGATWLKPIHVASQEEFVVMLRRLREGSGLTFKQIERLTSADGPRVLPASTLATALQRHTVPRPEIVAALVQVCGGDPNVVEEWLALRNTVVHPLIEVARPLDPAGPPPTPPVSMTMSTSVPPRPGRRLPWNQRRLAGAVIILVVAASTSGGAAPLAASRSNVSAFRATAAPNPSRLTVPGEILKIGGLCLSEKGSKDRSGLVYLSTCTRSFPPRKLVPYGTLWRVQVEHPHFGSGCMGVVNASTAAGAALSDDMCEQLQTERFILQEMEGGYRLLPEGHDLCVGVAAAPRVGSPLLQLACDPRAPGQVFTITAE
ncbi:helix-turn-helix transcriptional regulator [Streptosporangium canum]|uniref:helix-turn-helix domain-containing protein n=1 Tax=Streptosporangium canum TaxID=324952 RepID=UPI0033A7B46C